MTANGPNTASSVSNGDQGSEFITFTSVVTGQGTWQPTEGEELNLLLERLINGGDLPRSEVDKIRRETSEVLTRCIDPSGTGVAMNTGLVIGRIQSGKTMSFTAVTAGARDNGFDLIIVMGGTTNILIGQTRGRLARDLGLDEPDVFLRWDMYQSMLSSADRNRLRASMDSRAQSRRKPALVTLMKHHSHIGGLSNALEGLDLSHLSTLIVDDEADQHSLNTAIAANEESTTYRAISRLRGLLPRHTFLQYTATPQAPLLVDLADILSPDWTALLTPGTGYVGGATYFQTQRDELVRRIPELEATAVEQGATEPPNSLLLALNTFLLSFAAGHPAYESDVPMTRSMMVHPHPQTWTHQLVMGWLREILSRVRGQLDAPDGSLENTELLEDFYPAYEDLSETVPDLLPLHDLIDRLRAEITGLRLQEVNSLQAALGQALRWNQAYGWILVGGEMLNRGFTVKGLTVTYMPRGEGAGNADTLAQRARFYGYRSDYLDHCRVYLRGSLIDAYTQLVDMEERVREDVEAHMREGGTLKSWKRRFLIDPALRPTRQSVIAVGLFRASFQEWFSQRYTAMPSGDADANRALIQSFLSGLSLSPMEHDDDWGDRQDHHKAIIPLVTAQHSLVDWRAVAGDRRDFEALLIATSEILRDDPVATTEIVLIDNGRPRERTATEMDTEGNPRTQLMQGRSREESQLNYPGDRELPRENSAKLTIQIHIANVTYPVLGSGETPESQHELPLLAVLVRDGIATWLAEPT